MRKPAAKEGQATRGADPVVQMHQAALEKMKTMSPEQIFDVAVRAGIYTKSGEATGPYRKKQTKR